MASQLQKADKILDPIIKWPGGKERELNKIFEFAPIKFENFIEPFVGGGSVFMAMHAKKYFINDFSTELVSLYRQIAQQNKQFYYNAKSLTQSWENILTEFNKIKDSLIELYQEKFSANEIQEKIQKVLSSKKFLFQNIVENFDGNQFDFTKDIQCSILQKIKRMKKIEQKKGILSTKDLCDNFETAIRNAFYLHLRKLYNSKNNSPELQAILFFFIRNFAYSGMFRYNQQGKFNVPYGGIGYNRKNIQKKIEFYKSKEVIEHFKNCCIENLDFEKFLTKYKPHKNDFMFLDPPYDSEFSTYAKNDFTKKDQERLANFLINKCKCKWMLIIKKTDFIYNLYANKKGITVLSFEKNYSVSFMNRNEKNVTHLLVRNYV